MTFNIAFPSILLKLLYLYILYKCLSFVRFYIHARRTGFPIYISPIPSKSIPWLMLGPILRPQFEKYLPSCIYDRLDLVTHGWEFRRREKTNAWLERNGGAKAFAIVSCDECSLWVADPTVGMAILQRRKDFVQSPLARKILEMLGPNVQGANGEEWQRQRKLVAQNLNERISETVWNESCDQAQTMLEYLIDHQGSHALDGLRSIAINVIGQAGYGQAQPWSPDIRSPAAEPNAGRAAYFRLLSLVTDLLLQAAFLSTKLMKTSLMPQTLQILGEHMEKAPQYMKDMLQEEREVAKKESGSRSNFLSMLVHFSDMEKSAGSPGASLTEDEIGGNLFLFTVAGFDTTANAMGFAVILMAIYPEWQAWIREELDRLEAEFSTGKYEDVFPKCQRVLALMMETLRLFSPVMHATRSVAETQQLADSDGNHVLTPPMDVYVSSQTMHCNPKIWGSDALEFKPSRWIDSDTGKVITPPKGTFLPWSGGPRVCPGMKMSQVEFVATLSTLFRNARCEPLPVGGEDAPEISRERLKGVMKDSIAKLTLQVRDPKKVNLRWVRDRGVGRAI